LHAVDGLGHVGVVAVGGVDHHHVDAGVHQRHGALVARVADGGGRADQQAALGVLGGARDEAWAFSMSLTVIRPTAR
jgi:hypothetical protein